MSLNHLAFATISTIVLAVNLSARPEIVEISKVAQLQSSTQATTINLSAETLQQPYLLSIRTSSANQIRGQIIINGKVIQLLNRHSTTINLSPYLKVGRQTIAIQGNYTPAEATVTVELQGKNTQVSQQTSGNGLLNQVLMIEVR